MKKFSGTVCVDTNVLVYAIDVESPFHEKAGQLMRVIESGGVDAVVATQNLVEFYATVTNKKRKLKPLLPRQAWREVDEIANGGAFGLIYPNQETIKTLGKKLDRSGVSGQDIYDLFLAATMLANGVKTIVTENKRDFAGIKGLTAVSLAEL